MPAKSEAQRRLFSMAYAVRTGKMKRSDVGQSVLDIVDSDMTNKEISHFMVKEKSSLTDYIKNTIKE